MTSRLGEKGVEAVEGHHQQSKNLIFSLHQIILHCITTVNSRFSESIFETFFYSFPQLINVTGNFFFFKMPLNDKCVTIWWGDFLPWIPNCSRHSNKRKPFVYFNLFEKSRDFFFFFTGATVIFQESFQLTWEKKLKNPDFIVPHRVVNILLTPKHWCKK